MMGVTHRGHRSYRWGRRLSMPKITTVASPQFEIRIQTCETHTQMIKTQTQIQIQIQN